MSSLVLSGDTSGAITVSAPATAGTNTITLGANTGVNILDANTPAFRNRIINGAMVIDQRNAGASTTPTTNGVYTTDRWQVGLSAASKFSIQQSSTAPSGFAKSLLITSTSAYAVSSTDLIGLLQPIEGLNMTDVGFGTASASTLTLSFWVRSSLTGTFGGVLTNYANDRSYPFSYTINSANTFEQKTITITGDTSGTWLTTNSGWGQLWFALGVGSTKATTAGSWVAGAYYSVTGATNLVGTNGATLYITGVQLEKGSTATSFDYRPYGTELALCQRYLPAWSGSGTIPAMGIASSTTNAYFSIPFPVAARTAATGITTSAANTFSIADGQTTSTPTSLSFTNASTTGIQIALGFASGLTQYRPYYINGANSSMLLLATGCEL